MSIKQLNEMQTEARFLRMMSFKSNYTNKYIIDKLSELESNIDKLYTDLNKESIIYLVNNVKVIYETITEFFKMAFIGLDIVLSSINQKNVDKIILVFNRISKYINKIQLSMNNNTFYKKNIQEVTDIINEMKISFDFNLLDNESKKIFQEKILNQLLYENYQLFDTSNSSVYSLFSAYDDSQLNINQLMSSINEILAKLSKTIDSTISNI
jgi:hypothetical protein